MASNRSQIYIDTQDNTSAVLKNIARQVDSLQASLQRMGGSSNNSLNQMNGSLSNQANLVNQVSQGFGSMGGSIAGNLVKLASLASAIFLVKKAGEELYNLFKTGLEINIDTEKTKTGIAGLIATVYKFKQDGIEIKGSDKLAKSLVVSEQVLKRLRITAIETGIDFNEAADAFRNAVGAGAQLKIRPERLEKLSSLIANAAKAGGLDKGQSGQETRALFTGKIDRSAQIGTNLGFGPKGDKQKEYQAALAKGGEDFANFIEKELEQFRYAGEVYAKTTGGIFDAIADAKNLYKGDLTKGLYDELTKLKPIVDSIFSKGDFAPALDGLTATFQALGTIIGGEIVSSAQSFLDLIFDISGYLEEDQTLFNGILEIFSLISDIGGTFFSTLGEIFSTVGSIVSAFMSLLGLTEENGRELTGFQATLKFIVGAVGLVSVGFGLVKDAVKLVADSVRLLLGGAIDFVMKSFSAFIGAVGRTAKRLGLDNVASDIEAFNKKVVTNREKSIEKIIGADNKLFDGPNVGASFEDKVKYYLPGLTDSLGKAAQSYENAGNKSNAFVKTALGNMKKLRTESGKADPRTKGLELLPSGDGKEPKEKKEKGGGGTDTTNELLKGYEKELDAFKKGNAIKEKENELYYSNFKKTVEEFYTTKQGIDQSNYNKELESYDKQIATLTERIKDKTEKTTPKQLEAFEVKLQELISKRTNAELEYSLAVKTTLFNREKDLRKVQETIDSFKAGIDDLLGNRSKSNKIKLDLEVSKLTFENQSNPEMQKLIPIYKQIKEFQIAQEQQTTLNNLSEEKLNILRENGALTQIDYFKQLGSLNSERLKQYEEEMKLIKALAPDQQDNVRLKELENAILRTRANLDPLAKDIKKTFQDSFGNFFSDVISGTKSIKDAFKDLTTSISNYLSKLVSEKLAAQLFDLGGAKGGGSGGGGGSFIDSAVSWVSGLFGKATGGLMDAGRPQIVGEGGKEIFIPKSNGFMMNASRTKDFMNGGRQGNIINNHINVQTPDSSSFYNSEGQMATILSNMARRGQRNT